MPTKATLRLFSGALLLLLALPSLLGAVSVAPKVGEPFPDFVLRTLDGEERRVSDYLGTKLVLHVFASW